jgi:hypothetical protein
MSISLLEIGCYYAPLDPRPVMEAALHALRAPDGHAATSVNVLHRLVTYAEDGACQRYTPKELVRLTQAAVGARGLETQWQNLLILNSRTAELAGDRAESMGYLDAAIRVEPRLTHLRQAVTWSIAAGNVPAAKEYLAIAESDRVPALERWSWREQIAGMRQLIELYEAIRRNPGPPDAGHGGESANE